MRSERPKAVGCLKDEANFGGADRPCWLSGTALGDGEYGGSCACF